MESQPDHENLRRYPRIPARVEVTLRKISGDTARKPGRTVAGINIGRGGICLSASAPQPPGTIVHMDIRLQGWDKYRPIEPSEPRHPVFTFEAIGKVVWSRLSPGGRKFDLGIRFLDIGQEDYMALQSYLKDLENALEHGAS